MDHKDEVIQAMREMIQELTSMVINLRVEAGVKLKEKDAEIVALKANKENGSHLEPGR